MDDIDRFLALATGRTVTADQVAEAVRLRGRLRSFREQVEQSLPALVPHTTGGWRSTAADRYVERLDELQSQFTEVRAALGASEVQLDERIRRMRAELDVLDEGERRWATG